MLVGAALALSLALTPSPVAPPGAPPGMLLVPAGSFVLGRDFGPLDQQPAHEVFVDAFWLDETLVTVAAWRVYDEAVHRPTSAEIAGSGKTAFLGMKDWEWRDLPGASWRAPWGKDGPTIRDDQPVTMISWNDAFHYCKWRGKRLPTEAEWEYAMRAGSTTRFPWGQNERGDDGVFRFNHWEGESHLVNPETDGFLYLSPVKAYPANAWGFYDPVGNVWQWVDDWYAVDTFANDAAAHKDGVKNPRGPSTGTKKVARGGSWWCSSHTCHGFGLIVRGKTLPAAPFSNNGFRCAQDLPRSVP